MDYMGRQMDVCIGVKHINIIIIMPNKYIYALSPYVVQYKGYRGLAPIYSHLIN
jgi:hypothetical protein